MDKPWTVAELDRQIAELESEMDYVVAVISRGGADASGMRERLGDLESRVGDLLDERDRLAAQEPA